MRGRRVNSDTQDNTLSPWFVAVVALFVTALITANIVAVKLVDIGGIIVPAGTVTLFPLSYIIGDVLTEVYGFRRARMVIWLGFLCNLLAVVAIYMTQLLPAASFWDGQQAYERILGYVPRLLLGSFVAYLVGEFANAIVLARLKVLTQGRWLWTRTIGSTVIGQGLDSVIFIGIAFVGTVTRDELLRTMLTAWLVKSGYETLATPLTYWVVNFLKRTEGIDTFDTHTNFSPIRLS